MALVVGQMAFQILKGYASCKGWLIKDITEIKISSLK